MEKEIVYTDKYALIVSDDEIKQGDYRVNIQRNTIHFVDEEPSYFNQRNDVFKKVIAHLPLSDAPILEGVPLLPPLPTRPTHFESWMQEIQCPDNRQGCLVAHYSSKTTNLQGQEELIGKYLIK
jgi:hypothetical protein